MRTTRGILRRGLSGSPGTRGGLFHFGVALLGALLLAACLAAPARAQQAEADVFVAQAILAYEEKRYEDAATALGQALGLDPNNVDALYYTGLVRIAQGRLDEATQALEKARSLDPRDEAIPFQLGVTYFSLGKYDQAQPLLEQVFAANPRLESLGYYVGFMRYRKKDYAGALRAFRAGATTDPNIAQLTRFYTGLALGAVGLPERAAAEIEEALKLQPASPLTGPAERLREAVATARERERRFRAEVRVGAFYDDNVPVQPEASSRDTLVESLRAHEKRSPGALAGVRFDYSFLRAGSLEATLTYSFFGTYNYDLPGFNIVDHLGGLGATYRDTVGDLSDLGLGVLGGLPYQLGVQYTYDYLILDDDEFVQRNTFSPTFVLVGKAFDAPPFGTVNNLTALQLRWQKKQFSNDTNINRAEKRDGTNWMVGLTHIFRFSGDKHLFKVGWQWDADDLKGSTNRGRNYAYTDGQRILTGFQFTLPWWELRLKYDFDAHFREYTHRNTILPVANPRIKKRSDDEFTHVVGFSLPLPYSLTVPDVERGEPRKTGLSLAVDYQAASNRSNLDAFTFNRKVLSVFLIWAY